VVGVYRVYARAATDGFTMAIGSALNLPAVKVDSKFISYRQYAQDLKAIRHLRDFEKTNGGTNADLTDEQLSDNVLWRLVNNVLVGKAAVNLGVTASDEDIKTLSDRMAENFKTPEELDKELESRYGWNFKTYRNKVIAPFVLQNKVSEKIETDTAKRDAVRVAAEKVLAEIKAGGDFATLAKQYGQDGTASAGGDLGWFGKGKMVPEFENAAFALKKGETSPVLVETMFGYHIIRVDDKKTVWVKNEAGKSEKQDQVSARHILFRFPSASDYLDELARTSKIKLLLKVHDPFAQLNASTVAAQETAQTDDSQTKTADEQVAKEEDGQK